MIKKKDLEKENLELKKVASAAEDAMLSIAKESLKVIVKQGKEIKHLKLDLKFYKWSVFILLIVQAVILLYVMQA